MSFEWRTIEKKWQTKWDETKIFEADPERDKPKFFITVAYPYPNSPQHIGHGRTYSLTDVYARFKRMRGFNVLFPMAFHYTGTPVLAMSKRIADGDKELIADFIHLYKVPPDVVQSFKDPIKIANYFHSEIKEGMKEIGYSIDWRREFTTIDPQYSRFIEWHFNKLRSKNLITRGSHPVGWCPSDESPMGQHDTQGDVEPEIGELILIKFEMDGKYLPTATLRPETIFGVTNIWLRADVEYVEAIVEEETWIISKQCAEKLKFLNRNVSVASKVLGRELVGKYVKNPMTGESIPILPASFVDPDNATGVVMSVPGHAPYDYIALEDLKNNPNQLSTFSITTEVLATIVSVSIIKSENYSGIPAIDVIERFRIKSQLDPNLENATKEIYSHEFHNGEMKKNTGKYYGLLVPEARDRVKKDLIRKGKADLMYELLNRPVYCRCGSKCIVKIFANQWFIDYGNSEWKQLAHECLNKMHIFPEDLRKEFENVVDWLKEKACARKHGLGTRLPWDQDWIIESLSDSVIYMAYYIIAKYINKHNITPETLSDNFFNFVFLGEGDPKEIEKESGVKPNILKNMRQDFKYFYPLDSRNSGRDLIPNHLTFFIFNHAATFPKKLWPRQIIVNGSVLMEGKKMSKSFGNIIPLREAIKKYGADPLRMSVLSAAEPLQDADFSKALARSLKNKLERFYISAIDIIEKKDDLKKTFVKPIDRWMLSRLQQHIETVTEAMKELQVRKAVQNSLYLLNHDIQWYMRRNSSERFTPSREATMTKILNEVLETRVLLLAPFMPHLCEEIWHQMGHSGFVSEASWPVYDENKVDAETIEQENCFKSLLTDTQEVTRITGLKTRKIYYYTASSWKWNVYLKALQMTGKKVIKIGDLIKTVIADAETKKIDKKVIKFCQKMFETVNKMPKDKLRKQLSIGVVNEFKMIKNVQDFFEKELNAEVKVYMEDDLKKYDPKNRSGLAEPYRPAIFIE